MGVGPLRPAEVSARRSIPADIMRPEYSETGWSDFLSFDWLGVLGEPVSEKASRSTGLIEVNSPQDIGILRQAGKVCYSDFALLL